MSITKTNWAYLKRHSQNTAAEFTNSYLIWIPEIKQIFVMNSMGIVACQYYDKSSFQLVWSLVWSCRAAGNGSHIAAGVFSWLKELPYGRRSAIWLQNRYVLWRSPTCQARWQLLCYSLTSNSIAVFIRADQVGLSWMFLFRPCRFPNCRNIDAGQNLIPNITTNSATQEWEPCRRPFEFSIAVRCQVGRTERMPTRREDMGKNGTRGSHYLNVEESRVLSKWIIRLSPHILNLYQKHIFAHYT